MLIIIMLNKQQRLKKRIIIWDILKELIPMFWHRLVGRGACQSWTFLNDLWPVCGSNRVGVKKPWCYTFFIKECFSLRCSNQIYFMLFYHPQSWRKSNHKTIQYYTFCCCISCSEGRCLHHRDYSSMEIPFRDNCFEVAFIFLPAVAFILCRYKAAHFTYTHIPFCIICPKKRP